MCAAQGGQNEIITYGQIWPFSFPAEPLYSVVIGSGRALENIDAMRGLMSLGGED